MKSIPVAPRAVAAGYGEGGISRVFQVGGYLG